MKIDVDQERLAAEFGPAPEAQPGQKKGRPPILPDSFHVLVVGK